MSSSSSPPLTLLPIHARVRALLRSTCNGTFTIAGRSAERDVITKFVASAREHASDEPFKPSLFISGTPGTGKTALVNSVLAGLECCEDLKVISVNCMALNNVDDLWDCLCENIETSTLVKRTKGAKAKAKGKRLLDKILASQQRRCLLVLDELDHIAKSPHALSAIFSFARKHISSVRIIGIANTHTLSASTSLSNDEAANVLTLHFGAYTASQLLQVLQARLSPLSDTANSEQLNQFLPTGPLTLLSKKVASQTGDVRTLFEVLRGSIDLAVSSSTSAVENPLQAPIPAITPNHILAALKAYLPSTSSHTNSSTANSATQSCNSETAVKVRNLGLHSRLVLLAVVLASKRKDAALPLSSISNNSPLKTPTKRTGLSSKLRILELPQLYTYYITILEQSENGIFTPVSRSEFSDLMSVLETSGIVSSTDPCSTMLSPSKSGRRNVSRTSSFGSPRKGAAFSQEIKLVESLRVEEVLRGLGLDATSTSVDPREEEVRAIWIRENRRTTKDMTPPSIRDPDILDGAFEG